MNQLNMEGFQPDYQRVHERHFGASYPRLYQGFHRVTCVVKHEIELPKMGLPPTIIWPHIYIVYSYIDVFFSISVYLKIYIYMS